MILIIAITLLIILAINYSTYMFLKNFIVENIIQIEHEAKKISLTSELLLNYYLIEHGRISVEEFEKNMKRDK